MDYNYLSLICGFTALGLKPSFRDPIWHKPTSDGRCTMLCTCGPETHLLTNCWHLVKTQRWGLSCLRFPHGEKTKVSKYQIERKEGKKEEGRKNERKKEIKKRKERQKEKRGRRRKEREKIKRSKSRKASGKEVSLSGRQSKMSSQPTGSINSYLCKGAILDDQLSLHVTLVPASMKDSTSELPSWAHNKSELASWAHNIIKPGEITLLL